MLIRFFLMLRAAGVPASITEFLALLESLAAGIIGPGASEEGLVAVDQFYHLARSILVKDERHFDRFDRAFAAHFRGASWPSKRCSPSARGLAAPEPRAASSATRRRPASRRSAAGTR
jgi:uncharacterized protein with von Willebrand factor type A (vWA) domain